jgi:hypothetical protein
MPAGNAEIGQSQLHTLTQLYLEVLLIGSPTAGDRFNAVVDRQILNGARTSRDNNENKQYKS